VLTEEYGYTIQEIISEQEELVVTKLLDIDEQQKAFFLAKEIAYNYRNNRGCLRSVGLNLIILIRNNFYASYFCRCAFNTKKTTGK
jgi:hypothetical protein